MVTQLTPTSILHLRRKRLIFLILNPVQITNGTSSHDISVT